MALFSNYFSARCTSRDIGIGEDVERYIEGAFVGSSRFCYSHYYAGVYSIKRFRGEKIKGGGG